MRTFLRVGTVAATAALTFGAMAGVSSADTYDKGCAAGWNDANSRDCWAEWRNPSGVVVSWAGFTAYDEILYAVDAEADGRGVYIKATWSGGSAEIKHTQGADAGRLEKDLDIADGASVSLTMCQTSGGTLINCAYATAIA
ncbi:hypothetical protein [Streptomyces sp. HD]|uniref:hypothetical protein n=1 Tax=Streptomyces sp. HD TaxID=3020892 RepID=UPI00232CE59F|nr:hypothetical protein [Streptomyces sp. HD]MDC0772694.1 hypothetical protein [Streptomyces sp. HD]